MRLSLESNGRRSAPPLSFRRRRPQGKARGLILIYVVFVVGLLSLFAGGVGSKALGSVGRAERFLRQLQSDYIAQAAALVAARALELDETPAVDTLQDSWTDNPVLFQRAFFLGGSFSILSASPESPEGARFGLQDEERRVNLNTAAEDILKRLLEGAGGLPPRQAAEIADAIQDWRDEDTDERPLGAENFYYRSLGDGYACKDGPFENAEELLLVRGVTPSLYRQLEPWVTVHGSGRVNLNSAGEAVLRALGLSETGLSGFLLFRWGEDGVPNTSDDRILVSTALLSSELSAYVPAEEVALLEQLAQKELLGVRSEAFRMTISANESLLRAFCVLDRRGAVRLWRQR